MRALRLARAALSAPGFGTAAALGVALLLTGLGQSASLLARADPYRGHAALLALFLLAGSALLFWFILSNVASEADGASARAEPRPRGQERTAPEQAEGASDESDGPTDPAARAPQTLSARVLARLPSITPRGALLLLPQSWWRC